MSRAEKRSTITAKRKLTVKASGKAKSNRLQASDNKQIILSEKDKDRILVGAIDQSHLGIGLITKDGILQYCNQSFAALHEYSPDELVGTHFSTLYKSDRQKHAERLIRETLKQGRISADCNHVRKDGSEFPVRLHLSVLHDAEEKPSGLVIVLRDISLKKQEEELLRSNEATFRSLYLNSPVGLYRTAIEDGLVLECNDQFARLFGYKNREEMVGNVIISSNYVSLNDRLNLLQQLETEDEIINYEARFRRKDGQIIYGRYSARIYRDDRWVEGVFQDITAQKEAELELQASKNHMKSLLDAIPHMVYECDIEGRITLASSAAQSIIGYDKEELLGSYIWDTMASGMQRDLLPEYLSYLAEEQPAPTPYVAKNIRKDGQIIDVQIDWTYRRDAEANVIGFVCIMSDVTARKKSQKALMESERRLATLMNNLRGMVYRCLNDDRRTMEFVSSGCEQLLGHTKSEIENNESFSYADMIHPDDRDTVHEELNQAIERRQIYTLEYRIITPDEQTKWVWDQGIGIYSISGKFIALEGNVTDISRRKNMEFELRDLTHKLSQDRGILEEKNIALNQVLEHMEEQKKEFYRQISSQLQIEIVPLLKKMKDDVSEANQSRIVRVLENVNMILAKNIDDFKNRFSRLSPREIEISEYIAKGHTTKQISHHLNLSPATVNKHREIIRKKLELANTNVNLSTYLRTNLSTQIRIL